MTDILFLYFFLANLIEGRLNAAELLFSTLYKLLNISVTLYERFFLLMKEFKISSARWTESKRCFASEAIESVLYKL